MRITPAYRALPAAGRPAGRRQALGITLTALLSVSAAPLTAQQIRLGGSVAGVSFHDGDSLSHASGLAFGGNLELRYGKLSARVELSSASLAPDDSARTDFTLTEFGLRVSYRVRPALTAELGAFRRTADPTFATQDVGAVSIGLRAEQRLGTVAGVWVRGSVLAKVRYNGGGSTGAAFEAAFGSWLQAGRRIRFELDYALNRIDRSVSAGPLPLQETVLRFGATVLLWGAR